jgi:hypothetical protein
MAMARTPAHRAADGARFHARFGPIRSSVWLAATLGLLLVAVVVQALAARANISGVALAGAATAVTPDELKAGAAGVLERATQPGGSGYTFEIVQTTTIAAKPGGPLVDIPDPNDRHKSLGTAESYELTSYIERGAATPAGFWSEIRDGPAKGGTPDFEGATYQLGTIVSDGLTYRNDGDGWYRADNPPGIGLDPKTAALLPTMLRSASDARDGEAKPGEPQGSRPLTMESKPADIPGVIAVDAEAFTDLVAPLQATFDEGGRLVSLRVQARNTLLEGFDLLVDTTITFDYPTGAPDIPKPDPIIDPDKTHGGEG